MTVRRVVAALVIGAWMLLSACGGGGGDTGPVPAPNIMFLAATDGVTGFELWKTDGTAIGTVRVKDINPAAGAGSSPHGFTVFNNALYFAADDGTGDELWNTDGTDVGTVRVKDINMTAGVSSFAVGVPVGFTVFNNALYFAAKRRRHRC